MPLSGLARVTFAPGIAACELSWTTPPSDAVNACVWAWAYGRCRITRAATRPIATAKPPRGVCFGNMRLTPFLSGRQGWKYGSRPVSDKVNVYGELSQGALRAMLSQGRGLRSLRRLHRGSKVPQ